MMRTERTELRRLLEHLYARGFRVSGIDDGPGRRGVWGGVVEAVTAVDSSTLFIQRPGIQGEGSIDLVLGNANDGSEIVSDYGWPNGDPDKFSDAMRDFDFDMESARK
jgi:hypothetical protein